MEQTRPLVPQLPIRAWGHRPQWSVAQEELGLLVIDQALLALYALGLNTGCVLFSGNVHTYMVPVDDGQPLRHAIVRLPLGGRENFAYVAVDLAKEIMSNLPDLNVDRDNTSVGSERFVVPEAMFRPRDLEFLRPELGKSVGIHECVFQSIANKCDANIRQSLFKSIVLAGGNTLFRGRLGNPGRPREAAGGDGFAAGIHRGRLLTAREADKRCYPWHRHHH